MENLNFQGKSNNLKDIDVKENFGVRIAIVIFALVLLGLNAGFLFKVFQASISISIFIGSIGIGLLLLSIAFQRINYNFLSFLAIFSLVFVFVRIPFYLMFLYGEDGIFSNIYLYNPKAPLLWLIGQIDGIKYYTLIHHPSFSFKYMSGIGQLAKSLWDFDTMNDIELSFYMRVLHSFSFFVAWIIILVILFKKFPEAFNSYRNKFFIVIISNLPISIYLSTYEIHMDQSFGVFSAALLIWAVCFFNGSITSFLFVLVTSIVFNLGKNEWSFCFLIAWGIIFLYSLIFKPFDRKISLFLVFTMLLGFVIGNFASYVYDPENYLSGLDLMMDSAYKTTFAKYLPRIDIISERFIHLSDRGFSQQDFWGSLKHRMEYVLALFIFTIIANIGFFKKFKFGEMPTQLFLIVLGTLLMAVFSLTAYTQSVRYFALSYLLLSFFFLQAIFFYKNLSGKYLIYGLGFIFLVSTLREISLQINLRNNHDIAYYRSENPTLEPYVYKNGHIDFFQPAIFNRKHDYLIDWSWKGRAFGIELAKERHLITQDK